MTNEEGVKTCTFCGELLPIEAFYFVSKKARTRRGQCKNCMAEIKASQRDPAWLPSCNICGKLRPRAGPGRRLCKECFDQKYEEESPRSRGSHDLRLPPCPACGEKRLRADHVKGTALCPICRSVPPGRRTKLKQFYSMTPREFLALIVSQNNVCAICKKKPHRGFHIDHQHKSPSIVRGAICNMCNTLLGAARDTPDRLRAAADYLENPPAQLLMPGREATAKANRSFNPLRRGK